MWEVRLTYKGEIIFMERFNAQDVPFETVWTVVGKSLYRLCKESKGDVLQLHGAVRLSVFCGGTEVLS